MKLSDLVAVAQPVRCDVWRRQRYEKACTFSVTRDGWLQVEIIGDSLPKSECSTRRSHKLGEQLIAYSAGGLVSGQSANTTVHDESVKMIN
jgi:hypothetical protein